MNNNNNNNYIFYLKKALLQWRNGNIDEYKKLIKKANTYKDVRIEKGI